MTGERGAVDRGVWVQRWARAIGVLALLSMIAGAVGEAYVPGRMIVSNDAAATVKNLTTHNLLYRVGFAAYLIEAMCDVTLALAFYVILKPVHRNVALLSAFFGLVSTAVFAVAEAFYMAPAMILRNPTPLSAFAPDQINAIVLLSIKAYGYIGGLFLVLYGVASVLRGWLMYRSGYLPRWLGALLMVAGVGFIASTYLLVLAPTIPGGMLLIPMFAALLAMMVWFSVKGVDLERWRQATGEAA